MPRQCVGPPSSGPPVSSATTTAAPSSTGGEDTRCSSESTEVCEACRDEYITGAACADCVEKKCGVEFIDFGSGGYYRVKRYGCNSCWGPDGDNGWGCSCKSWDGHEPAECLGKGWTKNWSSDFCTEDFGIIYISGNGVDKPHHLKREGECFEPRGPITVVYWRKEFCDRKDGFNIINAKGYERPYACACSFSPSSAQCTTKQRSGGPCPPCASECSAVGNDELLVFISYYNTTLECVSNKEPVFLLTPTTSEGKKPDGKWCDSGRDEECESGTCGWIVDDEGDLKWEQCCKEKSFDYVNKNVFLCDDRTEGQTCYKDKNCAKGFCTGYKCKNEKSSWTYCGDDDECESGECGWIVDDEGRLRERQCCPKKTRYDWEKARFMCQGRKSGETCFDSADCKGPHACKKYHCT